MPQPSQPRFQGPPRGGANPPRGGPPPAPVGAFSPADDTRELLDTIAERRADGMEPVNSSQLRRFFGEVKDLYRQFEALVSGEPPDQHPQIYASRIEPRLKMIRSKVAYATRPGGQAKIPGTFAEFLSRSIQNVGSHEDFKRFVLHFEAVVGFMYGKGKVR